MTIGTKLVQNALKHLSAHSSLQPASPESIEDGKDKLNSMYAFWQDYWGINFGAVPLETSASEFSEPMGVTTHVEYCLAMALKPDYPGAQVDPNLPGLAEKGFQAILGAWGSIDIPKKQPRTTLPKGQGHKYFGSRWDYTFFPEDSELG